MDRRYQDSRMRRRKEPERREPEGDSLYLVLKLQILAAVLLMLGAYWVRGGENYQQLRQQCQEMLYCQEVPAMAEMTAVGLGAAQDYLDELAQSVNLTVFDISRKEAEEADLTGQGGWNPFAPEPLEIPANASIAMVVTNAVPLLPVEGTVTSLFGYRIHPITGEPDFHMGMDIAAEEGTAVLCALPGTVTDVGVSTVYGNYIVVQHSKTFQTRYCHLSEAVAQTGENVRRGARIGLVGNTGMSTGPHLHFDVIVDGKYSNPIWILEELKEYRNTIYTSNRTVNT